MSIVLAFSGGLDTSFCVPFLMETCDDEIITVTINTGGFSAEEMKAIEARSIELGAVCHIAVDARKDLFEDHISYLIKGNILRGNTYPLYTLLKVKPSVPVSDRISDLRRASRF